MSHLSAGSDYVGSFKKVFVFKMDPLEEFFFPNTYKQVMQMVDLPISKAEFQDKL